MQVQEKELGSTSWAAPRPGDNGCFTPGLSSDPSGDGKTGRPGDCPSLEHASAIQPNHFRLNTDSATSQGTRAKLDETKKKKKIFKNKNGIKNIAC